jgi:hypothetical protein
MVLLFNFYPVYIWLKKGTLSILNANKLDEPASLHWSPLPCPLSLIWPQRTYIFSFCVKISIANISRSSSRVYGKSISTFYLVQHLESADFLHVLISSMPNIICEDYSDGLENIAIPVVNDIDDEDLPKVCLVIVKGPSYSKNHTRFFCSILQISISHFVEHFFYFHTTT